MANRTSLGNDVVTGGNFISLGTGVKASKQFVMTMNNTISQLNISKTIEQLENITSDNVVTATEKIQLRSIWEEAKNSYYTIQSAVEDYELDEDNGWISLQSDYSDVNSVMNTVLSNMSEDSKVSSNVNTLITGFITKCSNYSLYIAQYATGVSTIYQNHSVIVTCEPNEPTGNGNTVLAVHVFDQDNNECEIDSSIEDTITWNFDGTADDAYFESIGLGKKSITISEEDYHKISQNWNFDVWVGISFPIEQLF